MNADCCLVVQSIVIMDYSENRGFDGMWVDHVQGGDREGGEVVEREWREILRYVYNNISKFNFVFDRGKNTTERRVRSLSILDYI